MAASFSAPRVLAVATALALSNGCASEAATIADGGVDRPPVAQITVSIAATTLDKGVTTRATAQLRDAGQNLLTGRAVSWASSNGTVARVDASTGDVTGLAEGAADIVATSEGVYGRAVVTVHITVASVSASLANPVLYVSGSTMAVATPRDVDGQPLQRPVSWTSSNPGVAAVHSTTGAVTAVGQGTATIAATCEGRVGQAALTVTSTPVASVSVTLNASSLTVGATTTASAVTRDASNNVLTGRVITWSSSNTAVATVNASGAVTAVSVGSANITATSEGVSGQAALTVTQAPVASVTVTLNASTLTVGASTAAAAVARDASNNVLTGRPVTWSSSNTAVATVNAAGLVTAVSVGSANIRGTSEGVTGQAALTVSNVPVASVTVTLASPSIQVGLTTTASAVLRDANNNVLTGRTVTWNSSNTAVATVNASTGAVTGVAPGTANIRATSEGVTGQATITVSAPPPVPVASVTVTLNTATINTGGAATATAVLRDANNNVLTGRTVTWNSSNTAVATVNASTGAVTGVAPGTANIQATSEGVTGQATITVSAPPPVPVASVTVTLNTATINTGGAATATAVLRDANNNVLTGRTVTWNSSNTAVATVNASTGAVTGVAPGTANIRATSEGVTGQATITVSAPPPVPVASVTVTLNTATINTGGAATATAVLRDANNNVLTGRTVTWNSSNTAVATVNTSTGAVTGVAPGTANIRATSEGITGQAAITVSAPAPAPVSSIVVTLSATSIQVGQTSNASAVLRDALGNVLTGRSIAWSSSNTTIATVSASGVVTGGAAGSASIRATSEGVTGSANVSITAPPPPPPPGSLVFASDWSTATGNSANALNDGGQWNDSHTGTTRLSIIPAAGLGFPSDMTNVVQGRYRESETPYWIIQKFDGWALPNVGGSLYRRLYFRHDLAGTSTSFHPVEPQPGSCAFENNWTMTGLNPYTFQLRSSEHRWEVRLNRGVTYRVEEQFERTGTNTWIMHARVYDEANNLVKSDADFQCMSGHGNHTMADRPTSTMAASCLVHQSIGWQGGGGNRGSDDENNNRIYYGGFAVSHAGWIGPYVLGQRR